MNQLEPVNPTSFFAGVEADPQFFQGPGGGGGGGGWGPPNAYEIVAGFTHTVWTDGNGNQKHTVTDANNNCVQATAVAFVVAGTVVTPKTRGAGMLPGNSSFGLDLSQAPQNGPWKMTVGDAALVGHQNNTATANGADGNGNAWQVTYTLAPNGNAIAQVACHDGSATWNLPTVGQNPADNQLDIWAILLLILAIIAAGVFGALDIALVIFAIFFLILIFGLWWVSQHI